MSFEIKYRELLAKIAETHTTTSKKKKSEIETLTGSQNGHKKIIGTDINDLYYKNKTYFNNRYLKELKFLLQDFNSKTRYEQESVQVRLKELFSSEEYWKNLTKKSQHELDPLKELFEKPEKKFVNDCKELFYPTDKDLQAQRAYRKFGQWKVYTFYKEFLSLLVEKGFLVNLKRIQEELTKEDVLELLKKNVKLSWIFYDLTRIVIRKSYDNLYNSQGKKKELKETSLCVSKQSVFYEYRRVLALYLCTCLIEFMIVKYKDNYKTLSESLTSTLGVIRNFIWRKSSYYDTELNTWWVTDFSSLTQVLITFYQESGTVQELVKERSKTHSRGKNSKDYHEETQWVLPVEYEPVVMSFTELPRVFIPDPITDESLDEMITPSLFGENFISKNDILKKILTIKQKKRFKINESYLALLKTLIDLPTATSLSIELDKEEVDIDIPFPRFSTINELNYDILSCKELDGTSVAKKISFDELHSRLVGAEVTNIFLDELKSACSINKVDINNQRVLIALEEKLNKENQRLKKAYSCISIGEIYSDIPLFITNTIDVRCRLYPKQSLISRTSGDFKQLLGEPTPKKLTISGYVELFRCYYRSVSKTTRSDLDKFEDYLKEITFSKKTGKKMLYEYFHKNPISLTKSKVFLYTSNLHLEILKAEKTSKTSVNVEIDQIASVLMFMALFFRNKKLAEVSNLLGGDFQCPYTFIMDYMKINFKSSPNIEFSKVGFELITEDRTTTKKTTMCFGYSQTHRGRLDDLLERAYELYPGERDMKLERYLRDYASQFSGHFNKIFPGIVEQIQILKDVATIVVKETDSMSLDNILGIRMTWRRFKYTVQKKKAFHPVTKEVINYSVATTSYEDSKRKNDLENHRRILLSYIIHSIDASVIQYIIYEMDKEYGVSVNTLHDCFLLHPNEVEAFYRIMEKLYKSKKLYNLAEICFFNPLKSKVSPDSVSKIEELEIKFYSYCQDFKSDLQNINIRNAYSGEN